MKHISLCQFIDALSDPSGGGSIFSQDLCAELNKIGKSSIISRQWKSEQSQSLSTPHIIRVSPRIGSMPGQEHRLDNFLNFELQNARLIALFRRYEKKTDVFQIHGETVPVLPHVATTK